MDIFFSSADLAHSVGGRGSNGEENQEEIELIHIMAQEQTVYVTLH